MALLVRTQKEMRKLVRNWRKDNACYIEAGNSTESVLQLCEKLCDNGAQMYGHHNEKVS